MYCSNNNFLQIAEDVGVPVEELYSMLEVVFLLIKKYGSLLKSSSFQSMITSADSQIGKTIMLLQKIDKLKKEDVRSMLDVLRKKTISSSFSISSSLKVHSLENIKQSLEKDFSGTNITEKETNDIALQIKGGGWYYKRGLLTDLDKMLK